jgi:preprotein translocase SecE subunit
MVPIGKFLKEVRAEMARVEWPSTPEFIGATIITLLLVLFFAAYLGILDKINKWLIYDVLFSIVRK